MSSTSMPALIFHGWVTLRMRMGKPQSSSRSKDFWPSPRPSLPWHSQHLASLEDFLALGDGVGVERRALCGQLHHLAALDRIELLVLELYGECFYIGDDRPALILAETVLDEILVEGLHGGTGKAAAHGAEQIRVQGQLAALGGAELEGSQGEVPGPGVEEIGCRAVTVTQQPVTEAAPPEVDEPCPLP